MNLFRHAIFLMIALVVFTPQATQAQLDSQGCGISEAVPSGCRQFQAQDTSRSGSPILFQFSSAVLPSTALAGEYMTGAIEGVQGSLEMTEVQISQEFGEEQVALQGNFLSGSRVFDIGFVAFRSGAQIGLWGVAGEGFDAFSVLEDVLSEVQARERSGDDNLSQVLMLLPSDEDLPAGFSVTVEEFSPDLSPVATQAAKQDEPTQSELEATIEALERQLEESEKGSEPTARPTTSQPLEIGSITPKDAGIGDGTIYVYVEVTNNSGRLYPYIGLEGTCRNASGSIIGTGFGNTANVAPRETVVVTMLFLSVAGCDEVEVRIDALTGYQ